MAKKSRNAPAKAAGAGSGKGKGINLKKILLGGVIAGIILNIGDGLIHGLWLVESWTAMAAAHAIDLAATNKTAAICWTSLDMLIGITMVWLYAAIRPRFGQGPRTALISAAAVYVLTHGMFASYVWIGLMPMDFFVKASLGSVFAVIPAALAGAWLYKE